MNCRLCTKHSDQVYHFFDTQGFKMEIVSVIAKHFWFEPKPEDITSHLICSSCWITTKNFNELYLLVEKVENDWKTKLHLKNEDIVNLSDNNSTYQDDDKRIILKNHYINQNIDNESNIEVNITQISCDEGLTVKINEELCNAINKIPVEEEMDKDNLKKRGRPNNAQKFCNSKQNSKKNSKKIYFYADCNKNDYQLNKLAKETKKTTESRSKLFKRTPEETAEFNKKKAEGDALIEKFMKIICNFCSEEQKNFTSFKRHCTSVHGQKGVVTCCQKKFLKKIKLVEHIERHVEPEKYKCHICGDVVKSKSLLLLHIRNKHEEHQKPYNCSYCTKTFKLDALRIRHELIHMPEEEKKYKCVQCDKNFPSDQKLKYHIQSVHDRHYAGVCDICGKIFNNRGNLKLHSLKVHEGVKLKFKCKYCDKEFTSRFIYNVHKFREHENNSANEYKCPMCNKVSKTHSAMRSHIRFVHKAKAKFGCTLCNKVFKRELTLKEHMATHTGQSLYSCLHCPRTFTHSSNMIKHIKLKHPIEFEQTRQKKDKKETWIEKTSLNL